MVRSSIDHVPAVSARFAARVPVYEGDTREHPWDAREYDAYRRYLADHQLEYREFNSLSAIDQNGYWSWRQRHPD